MLTEWLENNSLTTDDIKVEDVSISSIQPFLGAEIGHIYKFSCSATVYNVDMLKRVRHYPLRPERVIFNPPATIVIWKDGTKTVVKAQDDRYDRMTGLAMCYMKKALGNTSRAFNDALRAATEDDK